MQLSGHNKIEEYSETQCKNLGEHIVLNSTMRTASADNPLPTYRRTDIGGPLLKNPDREPQYEHLATTSGLAQGTDSFG